MPAHLPPAFRQRISQWRCGSGTFRMNVALSELPDFTCLPGRAARCASHRGHHHRADLRYMERAYFDARTHGWSKQPIVEVLIPSTLDDSLAPPGQHVASLFCQHVAPQLPNGESWDTHRETVADLMIETVNAHAPNFKAAVLGRQIMSPLDLERTFGLIGGDIFHGALHLDQMFSARPMLGYGNYRGPLPGFTCAAPARIRAAASPARRDTTRRAKSSTTSNGANCERSRVGDSSTQFSVLAQFESGSPSQSRVLREPALSQRVPFADPIAISGRRELVLKAHEGDVTRGDSAAGGAGPTPRPRQWPDLCH